MNRHPTQRHPGLRAYVVQLTGILRDGTGRVEHTFAEEARAATSPELAIQLVQADIIERFEMERITGQASTVIRVEKWLRATAQLHDDPLRFVA